MQLSRVQDLAGARITVRDFTAQDDCRDKIAQFYIGRGCDCKVIDRRTDPRYGYRAVHLVVRMDGILIEIQIRTELQDSWAQIFERLADRWGRGIRYGEDPVSPEALVRTGESTYSRRESVEVLMLLSDNINDFEDARKLADELKLFASRMKTRGSEAVRKIAPEMMATKVPLEPADWEIYEDLADMYKKRMNSEVQRLLSLRETMSISQFMRLNELFAEITQLELNNEYDSLSRWEIQVRARLTLVANAVDEDEGM